MVGLLVVEMFCSMLVIVLKLFFLMVVWFRFNIGCVVLVLIWWMCELVILIWLRLVVFWVWVVVVVVLVISVIIIVLCSWLDLSFIGFFFF